MVQDRGRSGDKVVDFQARAVQRNVHIAGAILSIYRDYSKEELVSIAKAHKLSGYSRYNKEGLMSWLAEKILQQEIMQAYFLNLTDTEVNALERAMKSGDGVYELDCEFEEAEFRFLILGGYLGQDQAAGIVVPREVQEAYRKLNSKEFCRARKRLDDIRSYCLAADWLYGITPVSVLLELFNRYEEPKLDESELLRVYYLMKPYRLSVSLVDGRFINDGLLDQKAYESLINAQGDTPFYMPTKAMVGKLAEYRDFSAEKQMRDLCLYMIETIAVPEEEAFEACYYMDDMIRSGCRPEDVVQILSASGIYFQNQEQVEGFIPLLRNVWNNTRMVIYRGYTPMEIAHMDHASEKVINFPTQ